MSSPKFYVTSPAGGEDILLICPECPADVAEVRRWDGLNDDPQLWDIAAVAKAHAFAEHEEQQ